jgi:hypothetical protein
VVGLAVVAHEPCPVDAENDGEILQADVVDDLVEGSLQERRVDADDRLPSLFGHSRRHDDRVLFGDADVVHAAGEPLLDLRESGPDEHRGADRDDLLVLFHLFDERAREDLGIGERRARTRRRGRRAGLVELAGVLLRERVSAPLVRQGVEHDRRAVGRNLPDDRERLGELLEVVSVHRPDVVQSHLLPDHVREEETLDGGLDAPGELPRLVPVRHPREELLAGFGQLLVLRVQDEAVAPVGEPADVLGDRPAVVVEDHDEPLRIQVHDVVQRLVARARGERRRRRPPPRNGSSDRPGARGTSDRVGQPRARVSRRERVVGLSSGSANPERPPGVRIPANCFRRPVTSLWV